jgi:hypothetical protein
VIIRAVLIVSVTALLALVLYLPSANPPDRFLEVLRVEHGLNVEALGPAKASRVLSRTLDMQESAPRVSEPPPEPAVQVATASPVDAAMSSLVDQMQRRLFGNVYFRSLDSLVTLASYRVCTIAELAPMLAVFLIACLIDGLLVRAVRSKQFGSPSPEKFAVAGCLVIVTICALLVVTVLPVSISPLFLAGGLLAACIASAAITANYHRRG